MRSSKSKARSHVEIRGLVLLYATTLEARGYRPSVVLAYSAAVEHFISWAASSRARLEVSRDAVQRFLKEHLKWDSLTRPHGVLPSLKPDSVDWIPGAPPGKSLTGMQFQYEAPMRHRPEAFAADSAIRGIPSPRRRPVNL